MNDSHNCPFSAPSRSPLACPLACPQPVGVPALLSFIEMQRRLSAEDRTWLGTVTNILGNVIISRIYSIKKSEFHRNQPQIFGQIYKINYYIYHHLIWSDNINMKCVCACVKKKQINGRYFQEDMNKSPSGYAGCGIKMSCWDDV